MDLSSILDPLDLEVVAPLLNWTLVSKKGQKNYQELHLDSPEALDDRLIVRSLLENPLILAAEHNFSLPGALVPNNRNFKKQWQFLTPTKNDPAGMNLEEAWNITTGSNQVTIAVIDNFLVNDQFTFGERFRPCASRVQFEAPFKSLVKDEYLKSLPHGELMLLALGACVNKKEFSAGLDWHADILAVERNTNGFAQTFLSALYASGIDVCKESLQPCPPSFIHKQPKKTADIILLPFSANAPELLHFTSDMVAAMAENNISVVAAAGNNEQISQGFLPASSPRVISVGALDRYGKRALFSNYGPRIDILAPGDQINFYYSNGQKRAQGTSIAAAYTAGAIALLKSIRSELGPEVASYLLKDSARSLECDDYCPQYEESLMSSCQTQCCDQKNACGKKMLDVKTALEITNKEYIAAPIIALDRHYILMFRSQSDNDYINVINLGDEAGDIKAIVYDKNLVIKPSSFSLSRRNKQNFRQEVEIYFKREPFKAMTFKVDFITIFKGKNVGKTEAYIEYIPKR